MNINVTMAVGKSKPFPVPVAWLALTNIISVLIFLPIISRVLYPCLEKCSIKVSYVARMMIGMYCIVLQSKQGKCDQRNPKNI